MKALHEWGIPAIAFLVWTILIFTLIPPIMRRLKRKAEQSQHIFDDILISVLGMPLIFFFLGLGLNFFIEAAPIPTKWVKY